MNCSPHAVTLQINLSPGDIHYAHLTVPALVKAHRNSVDETVAIVDCCRPQKTKMSIPISNFPGKHLTRRLRRFARSQSKLLHPMTKPPRYLELLP